MKINAETVTLTGITNDDNGNMEFNIDVKDILCFESQEEIDHLLLETIGVGGCVDAIGMDLLLDQMAPEQIRAYLDND